jgi:hypothetical protein
VFAGSAAEDQLNALRGKIDIERCSFSGAVSDAFDGDFVDARFKDCSIASCGGDALDFSGSKVFLDNVRIREAGDKGISVGELSSLTAARIVIENARVGVVSKDLSETLLESVEIFRCPYGLAVFTKKQEYGPAVLHGTDVRFSDVSSPFLVERASELLLDGKSIPSGGFDLSLLYGEQ